MGYGCYGWEGVTDLFTLGGPSRSSVILSMNERVWAPEGLCD